MYSYEYSYYYQPSPAELIIWIALIIVGTIGIWKVYQKAGQPGWACLIPIYNLVVEFRIICGRGKAWLRLLIPFYNIYWGIKAQIKLAHAFGKSTGFGWGLVLLFPIFICILGFGDAQYQGPQEMN